MSVPPSRASRMQKLDDLEKNIIQQAHLLGAAITAVTEATLSNTPELPAMLANEKTVLAELRLLCMRRYDVIAPFLFELASPTLLQIASGQVNRDSTGTAELRAQLNQRNAHD